jgi:SM-20-related protein
MLINKWHSDAFKGEANRVLSLVLYLNPRWTMEDGGELVINQNDQDFDGVKVIPLLGTLAVFLSEDFLMKYYLLAAIATRLLAGIV